MNYGTTKNTKYLNLRRVGSFSREILFVYDMTRRSVNGYLFNHATNTSCTGNETREQFF